MECTMNLARLLCAASIFACSFGSAQAQLPDLQGKVYDSHHKAIVGATASIGDDGKAPALTDSEGHFSIEAAPSLKPGSKVTLRIQKNGFQPWWKQFTYTDISQDITLTANSPAAVQHPGGPAVKAGVPAQPSPVVPANGPVPPVGPLWPLAGDAYIDSVQERLNSLPLDATDAQTTSALRGLFDAPIFGSVGEELPEDALYRFCRTEKILTYYQLRFGTPEVSNAAATATQNLIYLQDIFADLYGPTFSAKEQCNKYGGRPRSEYQSNLGRRLKERNLLDGVKAQQVINKMLNTLYSVGLASHAPPPPPAPIPNQGVPGTNTALLQIDSARINKWLDQGDKGGNAHWLKSVSLRIDTDERQIAKDLAFSAEVPQVDQEFTVTKGRHKVLLRLEVDTERFRKHTLSSRECLNDVEVDQDMVLTPFLTLKAGEITQCVLVKKSEPIPARTAP
jgi:hypothetical protein